MIGRKIIIFSMLCIFFLSISVAFALEDNGNSTDILKADSSNDNDILKDSGFVGDENTVSDYGEVKSISIIPSKLSTTYASGRYFKVKVVDAKTKGPAPDVKLVLKVFTGKKYKKATVVTDSKGIAKYPVSTLAIGSHKIVVNVKDTKNAASKPKTSYVKVSKAKLTISAAKITTHLKENKKFKITVKNKESKRPMKNVKVRVKVFTGKKYRSYSLRTDRNGVAGFNTKSLAKGTHKVLVNVKATSKVKAANVKSSIKVISNSRIVKLKVNGHVFDVKLEDNRAVRALEDRLKTGDVTVHAQDYGNFEKVGDLGFSLPRSDKYITTSPGDIVLYDGDEISLFYSSNSWSYTKLGRLQNANNLRDILGSGDVTLVLSLR